MARLVATCCRRHWPARPDDVGRAPLGDLVRSFPMVYRPRSWWRPTRTAS